MKKRAKLTIAMLLSALMVFGMVGMAFASEKEDATTLSEQGIVIEDASSSETSEDATGAADQILEWGYSRYICTAPEYLNVRTNKSTLLTANIRGHICANAEISAHDEGDGWHKVNFCGNYYYVSSAYLTPVA